MSTYAGFRFVLLYKFAVTITRVICFFLLGTRTIFAGSSCNDIAVLDGSHVISGHFDKTVRFWDTRGDTSKAISEITLNGRVTSLDLSAGRRISPCSSLGLMEACMGNRHGGHGFDPDDYCIGTLSKSLTDNCSLSLMIMITTFLFVSDDAGLGQERHWPFSVDLNRFLITVTVIIHHYLFSQYLYLTTYFNIPQLTFPTLQHNNCLILPCPGYLTFPTLHCHDIRYYSSSVYIALCWVPYAHYVILSYIYFMLYYITQSYITTNDITIACPSLLS